MSVLPALRDDVMVRAAHVWWCGFRLDGPTRGAERSIWVLVAHSLWLTSDARYMDSTIRPCRRCTADAVVIAMAFDGNVVDMESCDTCDTRVWSMAGEPVELQDVLTEVGLHAGRRRSPA